MSSVNIGGKEYTQMFPMEEWDCPEAFMFAGVKGLEPMLAKEIESEEEQRKVLEDRNYFIEEKFDGTRALVHFFSGMDGHGKVLRSGELGEGFNYPLAFVLINSTKNVGWKIKDYFLRASNDSNITSSDKMEFLRGLLNGTDTEYADSDSTVSVNFTSQYIQCYVVNKNSSISSGRFKYSYKESVYVLERLISEDYYGEESGYCRVFSRRISKKTNFYAENTDSLPHIRDLSFPELAGTVLDGEMFIDGLPFKEVSSTLNCLWDEAVRRQNEKGFVSFHAFDIIFYKGIDLRRMPLYKRKKFLQIVVEKIGSPYIQMVHYQRCGQDIDIRPYEKTHGTAEKAYNDLVEKGKIDSYPNLSNSCLSHKLDKSHLSPRAFYEYVIATGGEGVIVKPCDGLYKHKRGWEYSKIKAFLTREMILIDFASPTKEYTGKAPKDWEYWEDGIPVTKYYARGQVGNMKLGVIISDEEYSKIPKNKQGQLYRVSCDGEIHQVMEVCECGGITDEDREEFTNNEQKYIGKVVEVKANGLMMDSGRMRHPRYLRLRPDKSPEQCTWKDHIGD